MSAYVMSGPANRFVATSNKLVSCTNSWCTGPPGANCLASSRVSMNRTQATRRKAALCADTMSATKSACARWDAALPSAPGTRTRPRHKVSSSAAAQAGFPTRTSNACNVTKHG